MSCKFTSLLGHLCHHLWIVICLALALLCVVKRSSMPIPYKVEADWTSVQSTYNNLLYKLTGYPLLWDFQWTTSLHWYIVGIASFLHTLNERWAMSDNQIKFSPPSKINTYEKLVDASIARPSGISSKLFTGNNSRPIITISWII